MVRPTLGLMLRLVRLFTSKPILFDVYAMTYGTLVEDRQLRDPGACWQSCSG